MLGLGVAVWQVLGTGTVEPSNKGHFRASHVVLCREVILFLEVQNVLALWEWYFEECPLKRGRPFLGGFFIGGSTVVHNCVLQSRLAYANGPYLLTKVFAFKGPSFRGSKRFCAF